MLYFILGSRQKDSDKEKKVRAIDTEEALASEERISEVVKYILEHFDQKTMRNSYYSLKGQRVNGFNSMFAVSSIPVCKKYYLELKKQIALHHRELIIATIFSFAPNETDTADGILDDESFDTGGLDQNSRDFLEMAIDDYNKTFKTNFDTSGKGFQDYYKDVSDKVKGREIDFHDYTGTYHDVYNEIKPKQDSQDSIMDDVVFEMELVKQVEVNIDYILMLVAKYHDSNCEDKEILIAIDKAIKSSLQLRYKKELIENFIATVNTSTDVNTDWQRFVRQQREADIQALINEERLKSDETKKFVENAFRDGILKTTGTDVDRLMPPVSRFGGGGSRDRKKQTVIEKLKAFFEKYFGLISAEFEKEPEKITYHYDVPENLSMVAEKPSYYGKNK